MSKDTNFVSIKFIINQLLRDEPYIQEINLGDAVEWATECLNLLGVNNLHTSFICTLEVDDYKTKLPDNFRTIEAVRETVSTIGLQQTTHKFPKAVSENNKFTSELHFYIKENIMFFEFEEGEVEILFTGYNLDEDGFPKIPDDERVIKAIYWFIAHKLAYKAWAMGKMKDSLYVRTEQEYLFYMGSARYSRNMPDKLQMQSIVDQQLQLVPNMRLFRHNFVNLNNLGNMVIRYD